VEQRTWNSEAWNVVFRLASWNTGTWNGGIVEAVTDERYDAADERY